MIHCYGATHTGRRRRNNEDAFALLPEHHAAVVADGMGGAQCGEVGSAITLDAVSAYLADATPGRTPAEVAVEAIEFANREVLAAAKLRAECEGMGSTVVLALWSLPEMVLANVGDSRAYLFRAGNLRQLSYDQSFANELRVQLGFSEDCLRSMPNQHVLTMAVGTFDRVLIRTHVERLQSGDRILLCSDGLSRPVDDWTLSQILSVGGSLQEQVSRLIECANECGGPDNVTAVLMEYEGS
jgi:serine/threonine protein phosphatase PrpC